MSGSASPVILAGDVGGTNVRLALFDASGRGLVKRDEARFRSRELKGLEEAVARFPGAQTGFSAAGFGVAGPVRHGRCEATNLPWVVDRSVLAGRLGLSRVALVNDLVANAIGLDELAPSDFAVLNAGDEDPEGNRALVSAGTGLGEGFLVRDGGRWIAHPSEGGHASFAPSDPDGMDLLAWLVKRHGHVSFERVVSGPGLAELYRFERERSGLPEPAWLGEELLRDAGRAVTDAALSTRDGVAVRALNRWISIYGSEAGNFALKVMATAGVFLGGGIAPKVVSKLLDGGFFRAFCDKGRLGSLLARIPVRVVLNDECALLGAARAAARQEARP